MPLSGRPSRGMRESDQGDQGRSGPGRLASWHGFDLLEDQAQKNRREGLAGWQEEGESAGPW
jgi:hypothetical protein